MIKFVRIRVEPEETDPWPGPNWDPVVYDGSYPQVHEPGDIYINRYRDPPLYYVFNRKGNCELVSREELVEWVRSGLMKNPTPVQIPTRPSRTSETSTSGSGSKSSQPSNQPFVEPAW